PPAQEGDDRQRRHGAELDGDELRGAQLEVGLLELLRERLLALLDIALPEPLGGRLEEAGDRLAQVARLPAGRGRNRRPRADAVLEEAVLHLLSALAGTPRGGDADEDHEDSGGAEQSGDEHYRVHLLLLLVHLVEGGLSGRVEDLVRDFLAARLEVIEAHRTDAGGGVITDGLALFTDANLLEHEDLLVLDLAALDTDDLGDRDDLARTAAQTLLLHDDVHRRRHLLTDRARRKVGAGHQHQRFQAAQALVRVAGVERRHRAVVAAVHGLEHVPRLT